MAILGCLWSFWHIKKGLKTDVFKPAGRGIRTSPVTKIKDFEQVPENLVTRKLVMRTYLAIRKAEPRRSGVKSPRLNDSSNPLFLFQRKKRAQLCSLSSWQRYKNLNASVQNLVTRYARNKDSSNPYLLLSKKKTDIRVDVCFLLAEV